MTGKTTAEPSRSFVIGCGSGSDRAKTVSGPISGRAFFGSTTMSFPELDAERVEERPEPEVDNGGPGPGGELRVEEEERPPPAVEIRLEDRPSRAR